MPHFRTDQSERLEARPLIFSSRTPPPSAFPSLRTRLYHAEPHLWWESNICRSRSFKVADAAACGLITPSKCKCGRQLNDGFTVMIRRYNCATWRNSSDWACRWNHSAYIWCCCILVGASAAADLRRACAASLWLIPSAHVIPLLITTIIH